MITAQLASANEARALTDRIKVAVEASWELIKEAYQTKAWRALGYSSWDDYCTREFGTSRLRLPREERQEAVASMREIGMSTRAIAAATGHDKNTITNDLRQVSEIRTPEPESGEVLDAEVVEEPDEEKEETEVAELASVTGIDGKTYKAQRPAVDRKQKRPPLPPRFRRATADLTKLVGRIRQLTADDRFHANKVAIADDCVPQLRQATDMLQDLLDALAAE